MRPLDNRPRPMRSPSIAMPAWLFIGQWFQKTYFCVLTPTRFTTKSIYGNPLPFDWARTQPTLLQSRSKVKLIKDVSRILRSLWNNKNSMNNFPIKTYYLQWKNLQHTVTKAYSSPAPGGARARTLRILDSWRCVLESCRAEFWSHTLQHLNLYLVITLPL